MGSSQPPTTVRSSSSSELAGVDARDDVRDDAREEGHDDVRTGFDALFVQEYSDRFTLVSNSSPCSCMRVDMRAATISVFRIRCVSCMPRSIRSG